MGMTGAEGEGCILADEMGLGKTLQTIALIYTMLSRCSRPPEGKPCLMISQSSLPLPIKHPCASQSFASGRHNTDIYCLLLRIVSAKRSLCVL